MEGRLIWQKQRLALVGFCDVPSPDPQGRIIAWQGSESSYDDEYSK